MQTELETIATQAPMPRVETGREPRTSRLAVASLICLGLSLFFFLFLIFVGAASMSHETPFTALALFGFLSGGFALAALILAIQALVSIRRSRGRLTGGVYAAATLILEGLLVAAACVLMLFVAVRPMPNPSDRSPAPVSKDLRPTDPLPGNHGESVLQEVSRGLSAYGSLQVRFETEDREREEVRQQRGTLLLQSGNKMRLEHDDLRVVSDGVHQTTEFAEVFGKGDTPNDLRERIAYALTYSGIAAWTGMDVETRSPGWRSEHGKRKAIVDLLRVSDVRWGSREQRSGQTLVRVDYRVTVSTGHEDQPTIWHTNVWIDEATSLPVKRFSVSQGGRTHTETYVGFEVNPPIPPERFLLPTRK